MRSDAMKKSKFHNMDQLLNKKSHKVDFKDNKAKIREELISDRDENLSN